MGARKDVGVVEDGVCEAPARAEEDERRSLGGGEPPSSVGVARRRASLAPRARGVEVEVRPSAECGVHVVDRGDDFEERHGRLARRNAARARSADPMDLHPLRELALRRDRMDDEQRRTP